ncbi:MAG: AAA family ATPase [Cyanobacteria bacterium P01_E01_bin.42]
MKIKEISVTGLFGVFDRIIPLNMDEKITIIHAPNGFGKTIILKILHGLFNSNYFVFWNILFNSFTVTFDNNYQVKVIKEFELISDHFFLNQKTKIGKINVNFYDSKMKQIEAWDLSKSSITHARHELPDSIEEIEKMIPYVKRIGRDEWKDIVTGEFLSFNEVLDRFWDFSSFPTLKIVEPQWFLNLKKVVCIHLVESQRLLDISATKDSSISPTVSACSRELASYIQAKLTDYGTVSQSLDRTFPARVVKRKLLPNVAEEKLLQQLDELENNRFRLIEVGLLDEDEEAAFEIPSRTLDDSTKQILSVYIEDTKEKLNVFNDIANKIYFLKTIINKKFKSSHKKMIIDKESGFVFTIPYFESDGYSETYLQPRDLSSGEQHEIVLLYELLFKVKPNSLVLIDEPEISLHVGWQVDFLKDLQEITKLVDIDILIATHSPDIIHDRWDLTVELQGVKA